MIQLVRQLVAILATRHQQDADRDDGGLIVTLTELYEEAIAQLREEFREEFREEGELVGQERATLELVTNILRVRFGEVDAELAGIIGAISTTPSEEFTPLLLQLSREELLARFGNNG